MVVIRIEPLDLYGAGTWDSIVAESSNGTIFHCTDWLELSRELDLPFSGIPGVNLSRKMIVMTADGEPAGIIAGIECNILGLKALISPARGTFTPYGGLVVRDQQMAGIPDLPGLFTKSLLTQYRIVVSTEPPITPAKESSKHYIVKRTYVLDLTIPVETLRSRFERQRLRNIKRAEKSGVSIFEGSNESQIESYYDMWKETATRKSIGRLLPLSCYIDIFRRLGTDRAKLLLALHRDELVAGAILLNDNKRLYCWGAANTQTGLAVGASSLIQWKAILLGKEMGFREYDLVGGNIRSLCTFKASFGGARRSYYEYVMTRPGLVGSLARKSIQLVGL